MAEWRTSRRSVTLVFVAVLSMLLGAALLPTAAAGATEAGATKAGIRSLESELDRSFAAVRTFEKWDSVFPDAEERLHLSQGRTLLVSIFPQRTDGTLVPWADIAAAVPGSPLYDDLLRWAARLAPYQDQIYVTFNHEPEAVKNLPLGDAIDFQAAWNRMMSVFDDTGLVTLGRLFIVTSSAWDYPLSDRRAFDHWYPGDATVEAVGGDAYNFFSCRPAEPTGWASLATIIEGQRLWGVSNPGVDLMLPEFASVPDPIDVNRRVQWLEDARATLTDPAYDQFSLVAYFPDFDPSNPACNYVPETDAEKQALYDLFNDPGLGGSPVAGVGPTDCVATVDGTSVIVTWRPSYDAMSYQLFRTVAGQPPEQITDAPVLTFTELGQGAVYTVAAIGADGAVTPATTCTDPGPEPPPLLPPSSCEWARDEGFITVSWLSAEQATEYVVYRTVNNSPTYWRGRTAETELADTDLFANLTYEVRSRAIDGTLSTEATTCLDTSPPLGVNDPFPPTDCAFVRENGSVVVTWTQGIYASDTVLFRTVNGNGPYWRARTTSSTFTDSDRVGTMSYSAASRNPAGVTTDPVTCVDNTPPPTPLDAPTNCAFLRDGATISVTWTAGQGAIDTVVHRSVNGNGPYWRARTPEASFIDSDRAGDMSYTVTSRGADGEFSAATDCVDVTPA